MSNRYRAKELATKYDINVKDKRYREDGKWYHHLRNFPAAFFDTNGYIMFNTEEEYRKCSYLSLGKDVNIPGNGISSIPGYLHFTDIPKSREKNEIKKEQQQIETFSGDHKSNFSEGSIKEITAEIKSRNIQLKQVAIMKYGAVCQVCGFSFVKKYGELGENFIEIHHINPLSESSGKRTITVDDVNLVCSNCHRMLHRNGPNGILIEVLQDIIKENEDKAG